MAHSFRTAAIADTHGNADALAAVLEAVDAAAPDLIVNLGDHFSGPLAAGETASIFLSRPDIVAIRGNHDRWLVEQDPDAMAPSDAAAYAELGQDALTWLRDLPAEREVEGVFLCHGAPGDDLRYLLERVAPNGDVLSRSSAGIARLLDGVDAPLVLCAHTHTPRHVRLPSGRVIVNPGSVGCPAYEDDAPVPHRIEAGAPDARFAIIDRVALGWNVALRSVTYDPSRMAALARAKGRGDWARALETGWMTA